MSAQSTLQTLILQKKSLINIFNEASTSTFDDDTIDEIKSIISLLKTYIPSEKYQIPPSNFKSLKDKTKLNDKQIALKIGIACPNQIPKIMNGIQKKIKKNVAENIILLMQEHEIQPRYDTNTPPPKSPKKEKKKENKKSSPSNDYTLLEHYETIDWKNHFINQTIYKLSAKDLKSYIEKHDLKINGKFPIKKEALGIIQKSLRNIYQEQNNSQEEELENTSQENTEENSQANSQANSQENTEENTEENTDENTDETTDDTTDETTDDEGSNSDNEVIDEIIIQGIKYNIIQGYAHDIDTCEKLGPINDDPDDWPGKARRIHAKNKIEAEQANI